MRSDGSYVTIEWFHICLFPVYPLRRIRVKPQYGRELIEELPTSVFAILQAYAFVLGYIAWLVGVFYVIFMRHSRYLDDQVGVWFAFLGLAVAMLLPYGLLLFARWIRYGANLSRRI